MRYKNNVKPDKIIPSKLERYAIEAREYETFEEWRHVLWEKPRGKSVLGPAVLAPISIISMAIEYWGFKNLREFWQVANKQVSTNPRGHKMRHRRMISNPAKTEKYYSIVRDEGERMIIQPPIREGGYHQLVNEKSSIVYSTGDKRDLIEDMQDLVDNYGWRWESKGGRYKENPSRTSGKYLRDWVQRLAESGVNITIEWAYGQPRCYSTEGRGLRELSPRLSTGQMDIWLDGFTKGLEAAE